MGSDDDGGRKSKTGGTCEWTPEAVFSLLDRYGDKYALGKGLLRNTDWEEVVHSVNSLCGLPKQFKTVKQCRDKIDSLKKRYKIEKSRILGTGTTTSSWIFFKKMDEIIRSVPRTIRAAPKQAKLVTLMDAGHNSSPVNEEEQANSSSERGDESPSTRRTDSDSEQGGSSQRKEKTAMDGSDVESSDDDSDVPSQSPEGIGDPLYRGCQEKLERFSETILKMLTNRRQQTSNNPVQALADAIVGFSDMYARIELAKMEIYTDLQIQIAKNRTGRGRKRKKASSTFSDSEMR